MKNVLSSDLVLITVLILGLGVLAFSLMGVGFESIYFK